MTRKKGHSKGGDSAGSTRPGSSKGRERKAPPQAAGAKPPEARRRAEASSDAAPGKTRDAAAKKVELPAYGFAEDLLEKTAAADPGAEAAKTALAETDPRRIFRFADSLEQASEEESEAVPIRLETWVAFSLAGEVFALPVEPIREVVRVSSITRVPHAPKPIRGVTNMRGRVIPVIDLRLRIDLPTAELGRSSRVIVIGSRGRVLGLLVDAVHQVIHIDRAKVQPPPDDVMTVQSDYLCGVYHLEDQLILLLDIDRALILRENRTEAAGSAASGAAGGSRPAPGDAAAGEPPPGPA